ncbi:hypothetical protein GMD78_17930 [Ornithinibacillus sp. L9]|uniref:Sporulation lipoprotein YhcN/YlaJ (Spore_YhcN_YlaJ) n=1 Tax=Ornithinibacillus caprae TaxID=2678566 RepID=A0A6N8FN88_9BACI|nr:hypothetical protein [Ornithinibacillus caprae]MUK90256.1 hypothetical protein [Ornithinibacillus caprae]
MLNKKILILTMSCFILFGCGANSNLGTNEEKPVEITKISSTKKGTNQDLANQAKDYLSNKQNITSVNAVNTSKKLVIAVEVPHHERFQLAKTRKDLQDELKKKFSKVEVELSTDQKIVLELKKLEEKLQKGSMKKKDLEKEVDDIISLSKEQT